MAGFILMSSLSGCATYYQPAPPPLQAEVIGAPPYSGAVWISGHWVWRGGGYVWVPGHWRPGPPALQVEVVGVSPYPGAVWVSGHWAWRPRFGRYQWIPGHWRAGY